jgi:hypothetical protein
MALALATHDFSALANTEFREALNDMVSAKILTFHRTLNDVSFEFTRPN